MEDIYCGNNALHTDLLNGNKVVGNRYQCLRKGIGTGYEFPVDPDYGLPYEPIDNRKIYCGNQDILPDGYDFLGNSPQCLQKGIGIGKLRKAQEELDLPEIDNGFKKIKKNNIISKKYKLIILIIIFIILYVLKPKIICQKELIISSNKKIDWKKFLLLYIIICISFFYLI